MAAPDEWDTQAGTVELAIPKLRQARYFPYASLGVPQLSKPEGSAMALHLDTQVVAFRNQVLTRSSGSTHRPGRSGKAACSAFSPSSPAPTPGSAMPSARSCPIHRGNDAAHATSQPAEPGSEIGPALSGHAAADHLRTARHSHRPGRDAARPGRSGGQVPRAAAHLDVAQHEPLAFTASPREKWRKIWSRNPLEWLNKTIRRSG
ncbi:transposase [Streptomyces mirabilis]|uniref:transposase n=1 Tax=Streptomyces mirabilis TaxID=68239 RepID=UPI0027BA9A72|nr:transposase [Streptomyces sp. OK228]